MTNKEFLSYLQKIQDVMTDVSTGGKMIQAAEEEYRELYYKVAAEFQERSLEHKNKFSSLWDFYEYWSEKLGSYSERRVYVRSLYRDVEDELQISALTKPTKEVSGHSISFDDLHEKILIKCKDLFTQEKYEEAIHTAFKLIEVEVRKKSGLSNADFGASLMHKAFDPQQTAFIISEDSGEVAGWQKLFAGSIGALKNPRSHRFVDISRSEAFQILIIASFLLAFLDNLQTRDLLIDREMKNMIDNTLDTYGAQI